MQQDSARKPISLYDAVAERLRTLDPGEVERLSGRADKPDPEDRFTALVYEHLKPEDVVLDVGCGDGNWLRLIAAPRVSRTIGMDYGVARLEQARDTQREQPVAGLAYTWADARHLPFADEAFSVLIDRRGPLTADDRYMREGNRVLRRGGLVFDIGIGEEDAREVYEVFGKGQMFGEREHGPRVERLQTLFTKHGYSTLLTESLMTRVRLAGRDGLLFRLETTPMMPDFDRERDAALVDEVVRRHSAEGSVVLTMQRTILIARKN
jgi:SAM-dependent methyltransferase